MHFYNVTFGLYCMWQMKIRIEFEYDFFFLLFLTHHSAGDPVLFNDDEDLSKITGLILFCILLLQLIHVLFSSSCCYNCQM